jgi:ribose 5-phosphate isomerase A
MGIEDLKAQAAEQALALVEPGMRLGLGTGSTAAAFVTLLGARVAAGLDVLCVPTSEATRAQAARLGIPLTTLDEMETPELDLTIDGADEIDPQLQLIKGGGGALLREKIVAMASYRLVIIADESKLVGSLGAFPLPVEVTPFGARSTRRFIEELAAEVGCVGAITQRRSTSGEPFVSDGGNFIFDCAFGDIAEAASLEFALKTIPGVVETGLFLGMAELAFIARPDGVTRLEADDFGDDDAPLAI